VPRPHHPPTAGDGKRVPRSFHLRELPSVLAAFDAACETQGVTGPQAVASYIRDVAAGRITLTGPANTRTGG
jgi:hypothetical protein